MQQIRSTLVRHRIGKVTQNIFNSWFFILAFIIKTSALFIFIVVLFINKIYLSLYFSQYRWKAGFE